MESKILTLDTDRLLTNKRITLSRRNDLDTKSMSNKETNSKLKGKNHEQKPYEYKVQLVWFNIIVMVYLHVGFLYGVYLIFAGQCKMMTFIFALMYGFWTSIGMTGGAHRLWSHKSYKAKWPLRLLLALGQSGGFQNSIYDWVRDHRVHHKYCDTNADPHNSKRGFFFSHCGWLLCKKHKDVMEKGKTIDLSDVERDWVVMLQKKFYIWSVLLLCFTIPTIIPWYFWGENIWTSYWIAVTKYVYVLNGTWCVNSLAHMWGPKPYDKNITSVENLFVGVVAFGEGWHNYHHTFPWDYKTSELFKINVTTKVINMFAKIGWAYDLKEASPELIKRKMAKNNQEEIKKNPHEGDVWGWDDKDMPKEEKDLVIITAKDI